MWWKFRRHTLAMIGMVLLGRLRCLMVVFAEFISPYPPFERNPAYVAGGAA
jgi:ABC-type antimicrobial peptide transport system permease subunit